MALLELARKLSHSATNEAERLGLKIVVAVVDCHGNAVLKERMDGSPVVAIEMAERKAYTAAVIHRTTAEIASLAQPGGPLYTLPDVAGGRYVAHGGGVPIWENGVCIAGIGVSGATTEEDIAIVEAALAAAKA